MDWKNDPRNFTTAPVPDGTKLPAYSWIADWKKKVGYEYRIKSNSRQPDTVYQLGFNRNADCTEAVPSIKKLGMVPKITPYSNDPLTADEKALFDKFIALASPPAPGQFCPSGTEPPKVPVVEETKAPEVAWYMNPTYWAGFAVGAVVITLWNRRK